MAGIDKTYTDSYQDYKEFKNWAKEQILTFFNGHQVCIGDWIYDYNQGDFNGEKLPIMNTPTWLDIYLIQNCKIKFVLDRMKVVYSEELYKYSQTIDLSAPPPSCFQQNRKIVFKNTKTTKFNLHQKPLGGKSKWWLQSNFGFSYCSESKVWSNEDTWYPMNTNIAHIKSLKSVIRHLRKQFLPKGALFSLSGTFIGEEYLVIVC